MVSTAATDSNGVQAVTSPDNEARMPFMLHLKELRDRILRCVIALVITVGASMALASRILEILIAPAPEGSKLIAIEITENIGVWFKVSLWSGVILAMPILVYQLFAYVAPGLTSKEKRLILTFLPAVVVMFLAGVAFAYFVALPPALYFLFDFQSELAEVTIRIENYVSVVTRLIMLVGLIFETPLIVMVLARLGVVSPQWLANKRRLWIVMAFIIAAIVTPTFDPINQSIIAIPLILLLELGILLARMVYKKKREATRGQADNPQN